MHYELFLMPRALKELAALFPVVRGETPIPFDEAKRQLGI